MIPKKVKSDFPVLARKINNHRLVYLDNAATTQSPKQVIDSLCSYYSNNRANVHRGVHTLSEESTNMYEDSRKTVAEFLSVKDSEIIFVKNATEGSNLVAFTFLRNNLKKGDSVALSKYEHHSNILPWVEACRALKLNIVEIPFNNDYSVNFSKLSKIKYKFLAINHVSNFLGSINNISKICELNKTKGAYTFIDGAQGLPHLPTNLSNLGCDFYTFSGHKIYAPFGTGALFVKEDLLPKMSEFMYGGGMISAVSMDSASYIPGVEKYDAGTPNVGGAVALASALKYFSNLGKKTIFTHEQEVLSYLYESLEKIKQVSVYGPSKIEDRAGLVSFNVKGIHSHDVASVLDNYGVAVRSGQHCTMPAHKQININSSVRASIGLYNFKDDVDKLVSSIKSTVKIFN